MDLDLADTKNRMLDPLATTPLVWADALCQSCHAKAPTQWALVIHDIV